MNFKDNFSAIVSNKNGEYDNNEPAKFLTEQVKNYAHQTGISFAEVTEFLAANGVTGAYVNVDHQKGVEYTNNDGTKIDAVTLVADAVAGGGVPGWWNSEWTTGQTDEEIEEERVAEAMDNAALNRIRFESFGIGDNVTLQYSYDKEYIYEKKGRITQKARIRSFVRSILCSKMILLDPPIFFQKHQMAGRAHQLISVICERATGATPSPAQY